MHELLNHHSKVRIVCLTSTLCLLWFGFSYMVECIPLSVQYYPGLLFWLLFVWILLSARFTQKDTRESGIHIASNFNSSVFEFYKKIL